MCLCLLAAFSVSYAERPAASSGQLTDGAAVNSHYAEPSSLDDDQSLPNVDGQMEELVANGNDRELIRQLVDAQRANGPLQEMRPRHRAMGNSESAHLLRATGDKVAVSLAELSALEVYSSPSKNVKRAGSVLTQGSSFVEAGVILEQKRSSAIQALVKHSVQASMHMIRALAGSSEAEGGNGTSLENNGVLSETDAETEQRLTRFVADKSHEYFSQELSMNMDNFAGGLLKEEADESKLQKSLVNLTKKVRKSKDKRVCCLKYLTWGHIDRFKTLSGRHCLDRRFTLTKNKESAWDTCCRDADIRGLTMTTTVASAFKSFGGSNYVYVCCQDAQGHEPCE